SFPPDELLRRYGTLPLAYQPGERWLYNTGSLILGVLIARVAGTVSLTSDSMLRSTLRSASSGSQRSRGSSSLSRHSSTRIIA
ncbi:serine hydrolase, partial [Bradyrhizobium uaiense]